MGAIIPRKGDSVFANCDNFVEGSADIIFLIFKLHHNL